MPDGVIITTAQKDKSAPRLVRLQVMDEGIIRVSATPESDFPGRNSLILVEQKEGAVPFDLTETDEGVELTTGKVKAEVSLETGRVIFRELDGNPILSEIPGGGKTFSPIEVEGHTGYSFRQVFDSPGDEAFFGLGQHQSDEWNYKGKNEVLYQYNTKVSMG